MKRLPWEITREMFLSREEVELLLRYVRGGGRKPAAAERAMTEQTATERAAAELDRLIVEVLLFSGIRNSEFCKLRLRDYRKDADGPRLCVIGRADAGRTVHLPTATAKLLDAYLARARRAALNKQSVTDGREDDPAELDQDADAPLFVTERGRPFERTGLYRRVVRILTDAGLGERASVQLLRHTYGYLAYLSTGGNLLFVQRQLGHAHPMITSIYAQFVDESYTKMADAVARRAGRSQTKP